jgi:ankyrin repeat protein
MSRSFRGRVDLDQLRRQAKELRDAANSGDPAALERVARYGGSVGPPGSVRLALAQLAVAREHGFPSWPKLKAMADSQLAVSARGASFLAASVEGYAGRARRLLEADPTLGRLDLRTAAAIGDADWVEQHLTDDPSLATEVDRERGWPALLYVCYSHWHSIEPERARGMGEVARLLLDAGASPRTNNGARPHHGYRSALHGSVSVNNPEITQLLLGRGADPDDGESLYQAAGHRDHRCLELLLAAGATIAGTWAVDVAVGADDAAGVRLLLDAAARQAPEEVAALATGALAAASANGSTEVVQALLEAGADPAKLDSEADDRDHASSEGLSSLRLAVRSGNEQAAALLIGNGAANDVTDVDRFLGACARGDRDAVDRLLASHPRIWDLLADRDRAAIVEVAGSRSAAGAVALMLELGFSANARNRFGETPLHLAAGAGDPATVRLLLDAGAEIDARDDNYQGTPLGYATVGSGAKEVRLLLDAGADRSGVLVPNMPPSEEVATVLQRYGVTVNDEQFH